MKTVPMFALALLVAFACEAGKDLVVYHTDGGITRVPLTEIDSMKFETRHVTDGLVAYFTFQGNANDYGGKGINGVIHGALPVSDRFGGANGAYRFSDGHYIELPNDSALNNMAGLTLELWVKGRRSAGTTGIDQCMIGKGWDHIGDVHRAYNFHWDHSWAAMHFNVASPGEHVLVSTSHPDTSWHHLTATYNGQAMRIYIDGALDIESPQTGIIPASPLGLQIGRHSAYYGDSFRGDIDMVRIYNRALSQVEIRQNMGARD